MLVLRRGEGDQVVISGGVKVTILEISGSMVRLGFEAPPSTRIARAEVAEFFGAELAALAGQEDDS